MKDIEDGNFEEVTDGKEETEPSKKLSKRGIIKALKDAIDLKQLSLGDARRMRHDMGIFKSDFTKKRINKENRKSKRQAQKLARKQQRK